MKTIILLCISFGLVIASCKKGNHDFNSQRTMVNGKIIGFDNCMLNGHSSDGYIIEIAKTKEQVVTYNLPDTLFYFPSRLFANAIVDFTWPDSVAQHYKIRMSYRDATDKEEIFPPCLANRNRGGFPRHQIVILKIMRSN